MPHPLDSFFAPQSIALIGASRDKEKIPGRLLSMLRKNEYPGRIYPINPNYGDIDGLTCYKSIAEIGAPIDLAVIIIPARAVVAALEECAAVGVRNAVIISSGFAEEGGDSADAGPDRRDCEAHRHAHLRSQCRRLHERGAEGRGDLQPDRRHQAGPRAAGRDQKADRCCRAKRRYRLCHQASRQGDWGRDQLLRQRRQ
jgi:predicted CoA-binding protein